MVARPDGHEPELIDGVQGISDANLEAECGLSHRRFLSLIEEFMHG